MDAALFRPARGKRRQPLGDFLEPRLDAPLDPDRARPSASAGRADAAEINRRHLYEPTDAGGRNGGNRRPDFQAFTEQDQALQRLAQQQGTMEAEIVRRAIDHFLAATDMVASEDPFADMIGMIDGPIEADHDDIYR